MNQTNLKKQKVAFNKECVNCKNAIEEIFTNIEGNILYMFKLNFGEITEKSYIYKLNININETSKNVFENEINRLFSEIDNIINQIYIDDLNKKLYMNLNLNTLKEINTYNNETLFDVAIRFLINTDDKAVNDLTWYLASLIKSCLIFGESVNSEDTIIDIVRVNIIQKMFIDHYAVNVEEIEVID